MSAMSTRPRPPPATSCRAGPAPWPRRRAPATSSSRRRSRPSSRRSQPEERKEYLLSLGLDEPGLNRVIREGHALLDLLTFFTVGPKEARAWTVHRGATAPEAAGAIHTDFQSGFICAEVIAYDDFVRLAASRGPRKPARCASRAATTSCRTATSATSASTSDHGGKSFRLGRADSHR